MGETIGQSWTGLLRRPQYALDDLAAPLKRCSDGTAAATGKHDARTTPAQCAVAANDGSSHVAGRFIRTCRCLIAKSPCFARFIAIAAATATTTNTVVDIIQSTTAVPAVDDVVYYGRPIVFIATACIKER